MASRTGPRSVNDATRFTSTKPHATAKTTPGAANTPSPPSASSAASPSSASSASVATPRPSRIPGETPEQRVRRLRQAHLAAQKAQVSRVDRVIDVSRRFFDVAHRWTVGGIVVFTAVAGVVSIYSVWDMLQYNRARRAEWVEAQKRLEADELSTARLAYLKGQATDDQARLVEDANRAAQAAGTKLPPLISPPEHRTHFEERIKPAFEGGDSNKKNESGKGVLGLVSGLFGGSSTATSATASSSETTTTTASSVENTAATLQDKAKTAWDQEKMNQRRGGALDQLGLDAGAAKPSGGDKKGWWPW